MKKRIFLITLIIVALTATGIVFLHGIPSGRTETGQPSKLKQPPKVRIITVETSSISETLELTGSVEPYRVAQLASPAEGPVESICVREADHVKKGQALVSIGRKKGIDASIISLREELNIEKDNLNRTHKLVERGVLPREQLDKARAIYEKAHASLVKAEETAQDYVITAPWVGVVARVNVEDGEFVAPRTALLEMYDPASLVIRAAVPENHAAEVTTGMSVDVRLDAYPYDLYQGRIERAYPYLDSRLHTRAIDITLEKSVKLLPGMFARLNLLLRSVEAAVTIPLEAMMRMPKGLVVFVVEDGKAAARKVKTGIEAGNRIQLVSGIRSGDKVIIAGNEKLKNGTVVRLVGDQNSGKEKSKGMAESPAVQPGKAGEG